MPRRSCAVTALMPLGAVLAGLLAASEAHAHRLDAQVFVLPSRQIQVESWFSDGSPAKGAKVQLFAAQNQLLAEGQLDDRGIFIFPWGVAVPVRVVISAGAGHRKEVALSASALAQALAATKRDPSIQPEETAFPAQPLAERDSGFPLKDVIVGVGFVLAAAAFFLSLRNAQKLRKLARPEN